jgi:hypothetical protein
MVKNQRLGSQDTLLVGDVSQSPIICQMQFSVNEEGIRTLFSHDVHPVVVNPHYRLSTTVEALDAARSSGQDTYPLALDTHQMNNAIALQLLKSFGDDMFSFDVRNCEHSFELSLTQFSLRSSSPHCDVSFGLVSCPIGTRTWCTDLNIFASLKRRTWF